MTRKDFSDFKISLNLNIELDASLRRITEKIKIIAQHHDTESLRQVVGFLRETDDIIDNFINGHVCLTEDECKEE